MAGVSAPHLLCTTGLLIPTCCPPGSQPRRCAAIDLPAVLLAPAPPAGFLLYVLAALGSTLYLILAVSPEVQASNILVYVAICSIVGSLSGARCRMEGKGGSGGSDAPVCVHLWFGYSCPSWCSLHSGVGPRLPACCAALLAGRLQ